MKPLREFADELRQRADIEGKKQTLYGDGRASGFRGSYNLLQAWLRKADKALARGSNSLEANLLGGSIQDRGWSLSCRRSKLLGTTQKPKQEGK